MAARTDPVQALSAGLAATISGWCRLLAQEGVHVVGLSILSGGHASLVADVLDGMAKAGIGEVPVVVGGIIPPADAERLMQAGVARVYTPKDFELTRIMGDIVDLVAEHHSAAATA